MLRAPAASADAARDPRPDVSRDADPRDELSRPLR
jgi:hypothetical protein